jgi:hypothetical protein
MDRPYRYAHEKFAAAVEALAAGAGDARARVHSAWLEFHTVAPSHLPEELRSDLKWILEKITAKPARNRLKSSIRTSLEDMRNSTAQQVANRIVRIEKGLRELDRQP